MHSRTGSLTSKASEESKGRRVFGSLLRRHTSFGAPDTRPPLSTPTISAPIIQDQTNHN